MTTGRINQVTTIRETDFFVRFHKTRPAYLNNTQRCSTKTDNPFSLREMDPRICVFSSSPLKCPFSHGYVSTHTREKKNQFTQICDSSVDDVCNLTIVPQTNLIRIRALPRAPLSHGPLARVTPSRWPVSDLS